MATSMTPREVCHEHDIPLSDSGCWVCGHGGPIGDEAWPSWRRWVLEGFQVPATHPALHGVP